MCRPLARGKGQRLLQENGANFRLHQAKREPFKYPRGQNMEQHDAKNVSIKLLTDRLCNVIPSRKLRILFSTTKLHESKEDKGRSQFLPEQQKVSACLDTFLRCPTPSLLLLGVCEWL